MVSRRQRQVSELLHEEISQLVQYDTRDPRLGFVTVTGVEVTPDLRLAKVYISVMGDDEETKQTLAGLVSAEGYFRHSLRETLTLRYIPKLQFYLDDSLERGMRIEALLNQIEQESSDLEDSPESEPSE